MKRLLLSLAFGAALALPAASSAGNNGSATQPGSWSPKLQQDSIESRLGDLVFDASSLTPASLLSIDLTSDERAALAPAESPDPGAPHRVGTNRALDFEVSFPSSALPRAGGAGGIVSGGFLRTLPDGSIAWTMALESPGATAIRVELANVNLPPGASLFIYGASGPTGEVFGPWTGKGPFGTGRFWTNTVFGETAYLELHTRGAIPAESVARLGFTIASAAHLGGDFFGHRGDAAREAALPPACRVEAACETGWSYRDFASKAMGFMVFSEGGAQYVCSGGLLNDKNPSSFTPFFLTANHCIDNQATANSLECFWNYRTDACGNAPPSPELLPRTLGGTLLATGAANGRADYALLVLAQQPPDGATYLGWSTRKPGNRKTLHRLSFPDGDALHYSSQLSHRRLYNCGLSPSKFIFSSRNAGSVEHGSSGSPVMLEDGRVIGQLLGVCGNSFDDACGSDFEIVDGSFGSYFSTVQKFINQSCKFKTKASFHAMDADGGDGSISVTRKSGYGCGWQATSNAEWISILGPAAGTDSGTVSFTVSPNEGPQRKGTITVAGKSFKIEQEAVPDPGDDDDDDDDQGEDDDDDEDEDDDEDDD